MPKPISIGEQVRDLKELSPAGFAVALHISYVTPAYLFQSYPAAWTKEYSERGLHLQDPTVAWGFGNTGWIRWSALEPQDSAGIFARARDFGLSHGITCAVAGEADRSVASFSRGDRDFTEDEADEILEIFESLHMDTASGGPLGDGDRRALRAMAIRLPLG